MDSELTSEASVKALNQGVATTDSPSFAGLTVDTNTLYVDATNNQVGIGTTTVGQFDSTNVGLTVDSGNAYSGIAMTDGATTSTLSQGYSTTYLYNQANGSMLFGTNNTERMRIDSLGRVGIGTSAPSFPLEVNHTGANTTALTLNDENTVSNATGLYLRSTSEGRISVGSGAALTFANNGGLNEAMRIDSSGRLLLNKTNNDGSLIFQAQAPSGFSVGSGFYSGSTQSTIEFKDSNTTANYKVRIGSQTDDMVMFAGGSERMRIDSSGSLIIGTTSSGGAVLTAAKFSNGSEAAPHFRIHGSSSTYTGSHWLDGTAYYIGHNSAGRALRLYSGAETAGVALAAGGTSWGTFSDERLKYDIEPIENAVETLSDLRTVKYRLEGVDEADSKKKLGLVAQDLVGVLDEVIDPLKRTGDDTEYMSVRYTELVPVLVKAIQEQQDTIESLTARVEQLENN
jgi:hypothetical protein